MSEIKIEVPHWKETGGTCLKGYLTASFETLVRVFGQPHGAGDDSKSDAHWDLKINGTIVTIYNWKNGMNYMGAHGTPLEDIRQWNLGGFDGPVDVERLVIRAIRSGVTI